VISKDDKMLIINDLEFLKYVLFEYTMINTMIRKKNNNMTPIYFVALIFFAVICAIPLRGFYYREIEQRNNKLNHIGTFIIDTNETVFGEYKKQEYRNLEITFKDDRTYSMNMEVPFLIDTTGTWVESEGGFEAFGEITYSNTSYRSQTSEGISNQNYLIHTNDPIPRNGQPKMEYLVLRKKERYPILFGEDD
jgi:hypothetical protein